MTQNAIGVWGVWVSGEGGVHDHLLKRTGAGIVPSLADRTAALARLGYTATEDTWSWQERGAVHPNFPDAATLVGSISIRSSVDTWPEVEVEVRPGPGGVGFMTVRTERRDVPAYNRGPVPGDEVGALLGPEAAGWPALGLTVHHGGVVDRDNTQFRVFSGHRLIGFTMPSEHVLGPREYRAVVYTDREGLPYGRIVPGGLPKDPLRAEYDALRAFHKPGDPEYPAGPYIPRAAGEGTEF